jgi:hypothetical protein
MLLPLHIGQDEITVVVIDPPDGIEGGEGGVSIFIEDQLPEFIGIDHKGFVEFVTSYYDWFEQKGNPKYESFNLPNTSDIDKTEEGFIETFKTQFLKDFPKTFESNVDQRKLIKNIKDFYKTKGTEKSYKLLFRILFGEDPVFYYPKKDVFKASDGKWREPTIIKVTNTNTLSDIFGTVGRKIQQRNRTTNAVTAYGFVEGLLMYEKEGYKVVELELSDTFGDFFSEGNIECDLVSGTTIYEYVYPTLDEVAVNNGGAGYSVEDNVVITGGMGVGGEGKIESVDKKGAIKSVKLLDSGINYRATDTISVTITSGGGSGALLGVSGGVALDSRVGYYANNNGLISSNKKLQDNYYYQDFSYVIKSSKNLDEYSDLFKKIIHPAGTKMFSDAFLRDLRTASATKTDVNKNYETPMVGHYTSYRFETYRNLRANGTGGSGGTDLYPSGYGWSAGVGGTYVDEDGSVAHVVYGVSGPLGGSTHETGTTALNAPQGEQFVITDGGVSGGATSQGYWLVYPHPNSRSISTIPWDHSRAYSELYINSLPLVLPPIVGERVSQETPYTQDAIGEVTKITSYGSYNIVKVDVLSGLFQVSGLDVIGGTTGVLHGESGGSNNPIQIVATSTDSGSTGNAFNYIGVEDFLFGIER